MNYAADSSFRFHSPGSPDGVARGMRGHRRLDVLNPLPEARVMLHGPRWRRLFGITERPIADVAPESARYHRRGKRLLLYDFEPDVRELVLEQLRPGVYAMWSDPREWLSRLEARRPSTAPARP